MCPREDSDAAARPGGSADEEGRRPSDGAQQESQCDDDGSPPGVPPPPRRRPGLDGRGPSGGRIAKADAFARLSWFHPYRWVWTFSGCWVRWFLQRRRKPLPVPTHLVCPISHEIMVDPVHLDTKCGHSFDRESVEMMFRSDGDSRHKCPECREPIRSTTLIPNRGLKCAAQDFLEVSRGNDHAGARPVVTDRESGGDSSSSSAHAGPNSADGEEANREAAASAFPKGLKISLGDAEAEFHEEGCCSGFYEGELNSDGEPHGTGAIQTDNYIYEGPFRNGSEHGHGKAYWSSGDTYEGGFKDGLRDGYGIYDWCDGECYDGDWKNGMQHGVGIQLFPDGSSYEGEWKEDERDGQGVLTESDGTKFHLRYENGDLVEE